ncbi:MAG: T9SS type A sorting domain-containing protein [Bacteroidales bacterium]|nr:T9SS type A sorting domain-containing protein [Bacteroidales bacterium]
MVSIAGQLLLDQPHDGSPTLTLSTARLLPGVYRVVLRTDAGQQVLRVVKQ